MRKRISYRTTKESLMANTVLGKKGCLEWIGYKNPDGYGVTSVRQKQTRTHRLSWLFHYGKIPRGMCVCHKCDNPACINPSHLFLGTHIENMIDMTSKGRRVRFSGEKNPSAKLTNKQVEEIRELCKLGFFAKFIAPKYSISMATVYHIKNGRNWAKK